MSDVGQLERKAQDRMVALLHENMEYEVVGNWEYRENNANVEIGLLLQNLLARGYDQNLAKRAIGTLVGQQIEMVWLVDWKHPEANHFALA